MKILMVLEHEFPPDIRVENEIEALLDAGNEISIVCFQGKEQKNSTFLNLDIIRLNLPKFIYKMSALALTFPVYFNYWEKNLRRILKENNFDVIHLHDLPLIKVIQKLANEFMIKYVVDLHENRPEIMKMYEHIKTFPGNILISINQWQNYQRKYVPKSQHIILVTNEAKEYYKKEFSIPENKIHVVSNFVNLDTFNKYNIDLTISEKYKNKFVVVYLGDTGSRRGTIDILKTAKKLINIQELEFIIIGTSRIQEKLSKLIKKWGLINVQLMGWLPLNIAFSYLKAAKIGISPLHRNIHHNTTYANKIFQYMAANLPIIVSDCDSQKNIVEKENCGYFFEAGNVKDLTSKILQLFENPKERKKMGLNSKNAVLKKYNWQNAAQKLIKVYENL
ncbi:MAG: glycosyltransferase family 4 protein [FCB group bacterium]|nr:glycosyltransferase family 4 protein [FCB group bacterium]